jgi:hypothetical protein
MGRRHSCPVEKGHYDEAARAAIEACNSHAALDRLREALKRCIDEILAKATFDGIPKFVAERSPVVVQARAALADVPAPVAPSADVDRLREALETALAALEFGRAQLKEYELAATGEVYNSPTINVAIDEARAALSSIPAPSTATEAARDVLAERERQKAVEGWTPEHDDTHANFEMARAAAFYALHTAADVLPEPSPEAPSHRYGLFLTADQAWPPQWDHLTWKKPKGARRNLVRAAALLIAEIERLDRASAAPSTEAETK